MTDYPSDWSPLHVAVWRLNSIEEVRSLANSFSVNIQDDQGWTPVHLACAKSGSLLMQSHQVSRRGGEGRRREPYRSARAGDERLQSLKALGIMLRHSPNLEIQARGFCTPLHCAANSGWYNHAVALIRAGAPVYTGPQCSPLCWVAGGSSGNYPVAIMLRGELGEHGLSMIEADHQRLAEEAGSISLSSNEERTPRPRLLSRPIPRPPLHGSVNEHGLCPTCSQISFEEMGKKPGFMHMPSLRDLKISAARCRLCALMLQILNDDDLEDVSLSQIIVGASNGNHSGCSEPDRIRTLDFKVSEGCTCNQQSNWTELFEPDPIFHNCKGICKFKRQASVTVFASEANDQRVQVGNEITKGPLSSATQAIIRNWYTTCDRKHKRCQRDIVSGDDSDAPLPTRVIEVGDDRVRLVDGAGKKDKYLALSHRWVQGPMPAWVTRDANSTSRSRFEWFVTDDLPASINDAIKVTRVLGFQYLWIDSICIIQDSPEDWNFEASKMADLYANAYMTLFADCGQDDNAGFLFPRTNIFPSMALPIRIANSDKSLMLHIRQTIQDSYSFVQKSLFEMNVESAHLSDRAWIFQERILSRRILHFGRDQIFWECDAATIAEDGHIIDQDECGTRKLHFSKQAYSALIRGLLPSGAHELERLPCLHRFQRSQPRWQDIVAYYSSLSLTRKEDRLTALSGLASAYARRPEEHTDQYIAGLWLNGFVEMLSWKVVADPSQLPPPPSPKRCPSFSWIAVDSPIAFKTDERYGDYEIVAQVTSYDIDTFKAYTHNNARSCIIKAPAVLAVTFGPLLTALGSLMEGTHPLYNENMLPIGQVEVDHQDSFGDNQQVLCLQLIKWQGSWRNVPESIFLVLIPSKENSSEYRRIGIGSTELSEGAKYYVEQCMFTGAPVKTVVIT